MRGLLAVVFVLAAVAAHAEPVPRTVNDCTLLTDPTALRACVESFRTPGAEGKRDADPEPQARRSRAGARERAGDPASETPRRGSGPPR